MDVMCVAYPLTQHADLQLNYSSANTPAMNPANAAVKSAMRPLKVIRFFFSFFLLFLGAAQHSIVFNWTRTAIHFF